MKRREAQCRCGVLKAVCEGEPARISICHCLACKQRSGSAFSYNATFEADKVSTSGEPVLYERVSEEGYRSNSYFCPVCGCTLWYEIERRPDMVTIPVGCFADPQFPEPAFEVFGERRHDWIEIRTAGPLEEQ